MSEIFTQEQVNVAQAMDLVEWQIAEHRIRLYYPTCVKIAAAIRVGGKAAVTGAGGNVELWRDLAKYELEAPFSQVHNEYRRSGHLSNLKSWRVDVDGSCVVVYLDELEAKFYCTDALIIQAWLNVAARQAKAWAGDDTTAIIVTARLTDAGAA